MSDKPITEERMGILLEKYISPIYKQMSDDKKELLEAIKENKDGITTLNKKIDRTNEIQLQMEHRLTENIRALHDKRDDFDKKYADHEKRIKKLETPPL